MNMGFSGRALSPPQQRYRHIVDIGAGGAGADQTVHRRQGVVGVIAGKDVVDGQSRPPGIRSRVSPSTKPPAASVGPSVPSEPRENTTVSVIPAMPGAAARASS